MKQSVILGISFLICLISQGFAQLSYTSVVDPYEGTIVVNISTTVYDSWDVTGDVQLGSTTWDDLSAAPNMNLLHADAQATMELLEALEALENQDFQLASFSAGREIDHIYLEWSAATEAQIIRFFVQRSTDGQTWEDIGMLRIPSSPKPLEEYSYIDNHPYSGSNFYRLKQEDSQGSISYSELVAVEMFKSGSHTTHLFPNPAIFGATIDLNLQDVKPVYISLMNAESQTIATIFSDQTSIGKHSVELNLDELPKGTYTCLIEVGEELAERVLIK
ncbi:MAG: hypothetical protein AAF587_01495 [Bacteroidota bacterium]